MNKTMALTLLFSLFVTSAHAIPHNFFNEPKNLTLPQTEQEKRDGICYAQTEAKSTSTFCSFLVGGIIAGLGVVIGSEKDKPELVIAGLLGGIATGIITYSTMYPEQEKQALEKYRNYAPMNDNLQKILHNASTYNCDLLDMAQRVADINILIREIFIQSAGKTFPIIDAYNEFKAMLSYVESAERDFNSILNSNKISLSAEKVLRNYILDIKDTKRIIGSIMVAIKQTQIYQNEIEETRRADLYNAERDRIHAETHAASERARRERAERERARQEANLASAQTTQTWVNLVTGKPKTETVSIYL